MERKPRPKPVSTLPAPSSPYISGSWATVAIVVSVTVVLTGIAVWQLVSNIQ